MSQAGPFACCQEFQFGHRIGEAQNAPKLKDECCACFGYHDDHNLCPRGFQLEGILGGRKLDVAPVAPDCGTIDQSIGSSFAMSEA